MLGSAQEKPCEGSASACAPESWGHSSRAPGARRGEKGLHLPLANSLLQPGGGGGAPQLLGRVPPCYWLTPFQKLFMKLLLPGSS